jgi:hypothetical protein
MIKNILRKLQDKDTQRADDKARIARILAAIGKTHSGASLFDFVKDTKLYITYDDKMAACEARFEPFPRKVVLSPYSTEEFQALSLAHELCHAVQEHKGLLLRKTHHLYDHLINVRFSEAAAFSFEAQMAWELQDAHGGSTYLKAALKGCTSVNKAFQRAAAVSPQSAENGSARLSAFDAWFNAGLRKQYDYNALMAVRRHWQRRENGQRNALSFNKIRTPEQAPYMSAEFLREFGEMAQGKNFLEKRDVMADFYIGNLTRGAENLMSRTTMKYALSDDSMIYDFL